MSNTKLANGIWRRRRGLLALVVLLFHAALPASADTQPMVFRNLAVADGLSQNTIMDVHQDSRGYLWLATENGLDRYDGRNIRSYQRGATSKGELASDYIWQITESADGNLWLATEDGGVAIWNRDTDTFSHLRHDPENPASLSSDRIRALLHTEQGIWIATQDAGLNLLDAQTGEIRRFRHDPADPTSLPDDAVFALLQDDHGGLWIGTDGGLAWMESARGGFVSFRHEPENPVSLSGNRIRALLQDRHGAIWAGTYLSGLNVLDRRSGRFKRYSADQEPADGTISSNHVRALLEDEQGRLWVGTERGLNLLLPYAEHFHHYASSDEDGGLRDDYIMSLHQDRGGVIWVGTRMAGVHSWNPLSWGFGHQRPDWLENHSVSAFASKPDTLWVGTFGDGLHAVDLIRGSTKRVRPDAGHPDFDASKIMSLLMDHRGGLWVGTMSSGLAWRRDGASQFEILRHVPGEENSLGHDSVMSLYEDSGGRIWIGSFRAGATRFDPNSGRFQRFDNTASVCGHQVRDFAEDRFGRLWLATERGVCRLSPDTGSFEGWQHDQEDHSSIGANSVYSLHRDPSGRLWAGTHGGGVSLVEFRDDGHVSFRNITRREGLASNVVYGVRSDGDGALWLSSNNGLMRYHPDTGEVRNFSRTHGLQGAEFHFGATHQSADGRLFFGGANGYNGFEPLSLRMTKAPPPVLLTRVLKMNEPLMADGPISALESLSLAHDEASLTFEFAALDFTSPEQNLYRYKLEGFDDNWIEAGNQASATYTNLPGGTYVFRVAAATSDGSWNEDGISLALDIAPPPWQSPLAYVAYAVMLGLLLWATYRVQARRLAQAAEYRATLEREVAHRTQELEKTNAELKSASAAKGEFLARMSHEIRSPIHGVLGTTELLARTELNDRQRRFAETIKTSASSLLHIVNDVLDFSKLDSSKMILDPDEGDLEDLLDDVIDMFAGRAAEKGLALICRVPPGGFPRLHFDELRLRQVLTNLLSNAIKFTDRGKVELEVDARAGRPGSLEIAFEVRDTGVGIAEENQAHIFDAFAQESSSTARRFGGTGLGLSICRELIGLMGGHLSLSSLPDAGSTFSFRVTLPTAGPAPQAPGVPETTHIISDDNLLVQQLSEHLEAWGTRCTRAHDLSQPATQPGLVLVDTRNAPANPAQLAALGAKRIVLISNLTDVPAEECASLTLPLKRRELVRAVTNSDPQASPAQLPDAEVQLNGRVLVVEDNATNREVLSGMLLELGCAYAFAEDGLSGVRMASNGRFDAVLMDCLLPDIDGIEATRRIRAGTSSHAEVPIIALTANVSAEDRHRCLGAGMNAFLGKPCTIEELAGALRQWLPVAEPTPVQPKAAAANGTNGAAGEDSAGDFDLQALERVQRLRRPDGSNMLSHAVALFESTCTETLQTMRDAYAREDARSLRFAAHKLKSSAANLGAVTMADLCRKVEQLAGSGTLTGAAERIADIECQHAKASVWLQERIEANA